MAVCVVVLKKCVCLRIFSKSRLIEVHIGKTLLNRVSESKRTVSFCNKNLYRIACHCGCYRIRGKRNSLAAMYVCSSEPTFCVMLYCPTRCRFNCECVAKCVGIALWAIEIMIFQPKWRKSIIRLRSGVLVLTRLAAINHVTPVTERLCYLKAFGRAIKMLQSRWRTVVDAKCGA